MYSRAYVEITNICNMHCSFCHGHSRLPRQMSREEFLRVLDQLSGKTDYVYYHLMGEPLTHPLLPEFLKLSAQHGFRSVITTNGTLLHKRGNEILSAGLHKVNISLHSFEEGNDEQFSRYIANVADFAKTAADCGVLISLRLWNRGADNTRNDQVLALLGQHFPDAWTENTRGYRLQDRLFLEWDDRFDWPDSQADDLGQQVFCYGLRSHFGILCDGTVVPCCLDSDGAIPLGNVFREELTAILCSPRAKAMIDGFSCRKATEDLCRRCGYARRF